MKLIKYILFFIFIALSIFYMYVYSQLENRKTSYPNNACKMLKENPDWYVALNTSEDKWGTPIHVVLGMMRQESAFKHDARPIRKNKWYEFGENYQSSAFGYSQALDGTWKHYKNDTSSFLAHRESFADSTDFMGWYNDKSNKKNKISFNDPKNLYLAYHEGWTGYSKKTFNKDSKKFLKRAVNNVVTWSAKYETQLNNCNLKEKTMFQLSVEYIEELFDKYYPNKAQ